MGGGQIGHKPLRQRPAALFSSAILALALSACSMTRGDFAGAFADKESQLNAPGSANFYSSDDAVAAGKEYYRQGDYGHAEAAYRKAVELMPNDGEAWLGLAASYDRLRRFDLADRAYGRAATLLGKRPEVYNDIGYSYLLRGDLLHAREYFLKAYEMDPSNPVIANNLAMLRNSIKTPQRD
jgi:Flp pilus assembly protein TadD